jgi:membrane protein
MSDLAERQISAPVLAGWGAVPGRLWGQIRGGRVSLIAAGCAFYATLALFPGISMLVSLYGLLFDPVTVGPQLNLLRDLLPPEGFVLIARRVHALISHRHTTLGVSAGLSAVITLWSASTGTKSILSAVAHAHGGRRNLLRFQLVGLAMTLCAALAAALAIASLVALPGLMRHLGVNAKTSGLLHAASLAVLVGFVWASIAALYRFGPAPGGPSRPPVLPGAVAATALWLATSVLFSIYVGKLGEFDATYGPLAAVAGVMLWFWVSTYLVLLGAELNAALGGIALEQDR